MLPTVMRGLRLSCGSWKIICMCGRSRRSASPRSAVMSSPRKITRPAVGASRRRMTRPAVDLPQPLSPTRPRVSRGWIAKSSPSTARTAPTWRRRTPRMTGKCLVRFSTATRGRESSGRVSGGTGRSCVGVEPAGHRVAVRRRRRRGESRVLLAAAREGVSRSAARRGMSRAPGRGSAAGRGCWRAACRRRRRSFGSARSRLRV